MYVEHCREIENPNKSYTCVVQHFTCITPSNVVKVNHAINFRFDFIQRSE